MFEQLEIRNYRIFKDLKMDQLQRINLIAGSNNAGKTSLLEAIFLLAGGGNVQNLLNAHVARADPGTGVLGGAFIKSIFHNLDMSTPIKIVGRHSSHRELTLKIVWGRGQISEAPRDYTAGTTVTELLDEFSLEFRYHGPKGEKGKSRIYPEGTELKLEGDNINIPFTAVILLPKIASSREDALRLSRLRIQKLDHILLKALQVIEPRLQSVEANSVSGAPLIWGDIGLAELVPLSIMGEGMVHLARVVLAIAEAPDGVVLIDEIENGLHHTALQNVWRVIESASREFNTQVFATTHSLECVRAAHEASKTLSEDAFRLYRIEANKDGNRCVTYDAEAIASASKFNFEVR